MSKNRWLDTNGVFQCRSRGSCSVNLTAEYNRKNDLLYTWVLPSGEIFTGKNPPSFKIEYGDFLVRLSVEDSITGESFKKVLQIHHEAIPKAPKKTSSSASKYIFDLKDASDTGGGALPEVTQLSFSQSLLALFVLSSLAFLFF